MIKEESSLSSEEKLLLGKVDKVIQKVNELKEDRKEFEQLVSKLQEERNELLLKKASEKYRYLSEKLLKCILHLDEIKCTESTPNARAKRKATIEDIQKVLKELDLLEDSFKNKL